MRPVSDSAAGRGTKAAQRGGAGLRFSFVIIGGKSALSHGGPRKERSIQSGHRVEVEDVVQVLVWASKRDADTGNTAHPEPHSFLYYTIHEECVMSGRRPADYFWVKNFMCHLRKEMSKARINRMSVS